MYCTKPTSIFSINFKFKRVYPDLFRCITINLYTYIRNINLYKINYFIKSSIVSEINISLYRKTNSKKRVKKVPWDLLL